METTELIEHFRTGLAGVIAQGQDAVKVDNLKTFLDEMERQATLSTEARRLQSAHQLAHYDAIAAQQREMFKAVIDSGKEAINSAILINGGAVVVLMAFLGNAISKGGQDKLVQEMATPLLAFGIGVWAASAAFGIRYISQFLYADTRAKIIVTGHVLNGLSWVVTFTALCAFGYGVLETYWGVLSSLPR